MSSETPTNIDPDNSPDNSPDETEPTPEGSLRQRSMRLPDPTIAALFGEAPSETLAERISLAARSWREATAREAPSIDKLVLAGITRIDADLTSGYLSVVTEEDTWRAFVDREHFIAVVVLLSRRMVTEINALLSTGPVNIEARGAQTKNPTNNDVSVTS